MANREVLLGIVIAVASLGCSRPRDRYLIPDGYAGWLCISYGVSGAPGFPLEDDFRLVVFPPSGIVETSSPGLPGESYRTQYFYYQDGRRRVLESKELGGGFSEKGIHQREFTSKFWVSRDAKAAFPPHVVGKPAECGPFKDYQSGRASN